MRSEQVLDVVHGSRQRREPRLQAAAAQAQRALEGAQEAERAATESAATASAAQACEQAKLHTLTDCGAVFDIAELMSRHHQAEVLRARVAEREAEVTRCVSATAQSEADVHMRRRQVARNRQRIDNLCREITARRAALQQAAEDLEDEEFEEVAAHRAVRRRGEAARQDGP